MTAELREMLTPGSRGGIVEADRAPDMPTLTALARELGAGLVELHGPASKAALLDDLHRALELPPYMGRNWDALEEVLADPDPRGRGRVPTVIAWHDPDHLPAADRHTFRDILRSVTMDRSAHGDAPLVVVVAPARSAKEPGMSAVPAHVRSLGRVHHVALIVASIETALGFWRDMLGAPLETIMDIEHDRVRIAFLTVGESKIELVEPTDDTTGVARFLATQGEGFHHVCFEVDDLAATLTRLQIDGLELIDTAPRRGAEGPVAFIHPRSCHGVLVELIEAPGGPAWDSLGFQPSIH